MKRLFIFILMASFAYISASGSYGAQYWARTYGGSNVDGAYSIQQTTDGGYIVAGNTDSFGAGDSDACKKQESVLALLPLFFLNQNM
jgi:hypothetical protein